MIRIVLERLRDEDSIAGLCRREGINQNVSQPLLLTSVINARISPLPGVQTKKGFHNETLFLLPENYISQFLLYKNRNRL